MMKVKGPAVDAEARAHLAGAWVLVVEDNLLNQEVAVFMLESYGLRVEVVGNGRLALDLLASRGADGFELVLMDMQMPVMDGIDATVELRKLDGFARLPVVAMTANAMPEDRRRCLEAGMDDFVSKPITPAALGPILKRWIRHRGL